MDEMHEILIDFAAETRENLVEVEQALVQLEDTPEDSELIAIIFRAIHTVKGTCGFFGFTNLEKVSHEGENLLSVLRDGSLSLNQEMTTVLLELVDIIRRFMDVIEANGSEAGVEIGDLPQRLNALKEAGPALESNTAPSKPAPEPSPKPEPKPAEKKQQNVKKQRDEQPAESSVRVSTQLLDQLVTLVGELVLTRNQIVQRVSAQPDPILGPAAQRLNLIATELQESVMKTRMQPLSTVFNRFPRLIRDVARSCGKQVRLKVQGGETELDRTLIEAIKDPLTHILRNSIDHGIETSELRRKQGKAAEGLLEISASHKGGFVIIEIADDGAGIDAERIKQKALSSGVIDSTQVEKLNEREILNLIFLPGLSTAKKVTNVSGRGVGMDVVRSKVEAIGGTVELSSILNQGTNLQLKIPLTLAIVPALMVCCYEHRYAIPQSTLQELIRFDPEHNKDQVLEKIGGAWYHRLRGNLLPLVYLQEVLHPEQPKVDLRKPHYVVVLQAGDQNYGLVVDRIEDSQEIVVKPLDRLLNKIPVYAGTMITGDGMAALILDPMGLAHTARLQAQQVRVQRQLEARLQGEEEGQALLLFGSSTGGRMAIPLDMVARLEEFPAKQIEYIGGRSVIQYRGEIMSLIDVAGMLPERRRTPRGGEINLDEREIHQIVVHSGGQRNVGLIVGEILDTIEEDTSTRGRPSRSGVKYTFVQDSRVTEMLDLKMLISSVEPDFYTNNTPVILRSL